MPRLCLAGNQLLPNAVTHLQLGHAVGHLQLSGVVLVTIQIPMLFIRFPLLGPTDLIVGVHAVHLGV